MFARAPRTECASVEQTIFERPRRCAVRTWPVAQVEPVGQAVHLERDAFLERDLEAALEVERVLRAVVDQPPVRVREAATPPGAASPRRHASGQLGARPAAGPRGALSCTQSSSASTSSGRSSEPSGRMSHSIPRSTRNGASRSFASAISSPCRRRRVGVEPGHDADVRRVVADREVLVPERDRGLAHLQHARLAVRPRRVHVQVAAHVVELEQAAAASRGGRSRSSGGTRARRARRRRPPRRAPAAAAPARARSRADAGRAHERRPERLRPATTTARRARRRR